MLAILIPVYNDLVGLRITLNSLRDAKIPDGSTIIVVDDGSKIPIDLIDADEGIKLILIRFSRNRGIEAALNAGLDEARNRGLKYVARIDAGDTASPDRFYKQQGILDACPDVGLVGTGARFIDEHGRDIFLFSPPEDDDSIRKRMHINSCILHPTAMFRLSVINISGNYSISYPAAEDYDLFMRMMKFTRARCIHEPLVTVIVRNSCISIKRRRSQILSRIRIQWAYFDPYVIQSYLGILISFFLLLVPRILLMGIKSGFKRWHY